MICVVVLATLTTYYLSNCTHGSEYMYTKCSQLIALHYYTVSQKKHVTLFI